MKNVVRFILVFFIIAAMPWRGSAQINTEQVMRIGSNALYFEDYVLSIQYFNLAIQSKPYLAKPYLLRAIAKLNLEDYRGAEEDASKAIELNRFTADAYEVRGVARQNLGKTVEAIADYELALEQLPDNKNILFNKALAHEDIGEYFKAKSTFDKIIESYPGYDNAYIGRAKALMSVGDTITARADLDKALEINKNATNAYIIRSNIEATVDRDFAAAAADMDEAIKLQPQMAGLFINRSALRYQLLDYFGAMADLDYAITLDPLNRVAYFNRGVLRSEVSDFNNAISDFSQVLRMDPNDMRSLYNRSIVYKNTGQYKLALADITRVVDYIPDASTPLFLRAEIYDLMGNKSGAMRDYDKAMALSKAEYARIKNSAHAPSNEFTDFIATSPGSDAPAQPSTDNYIDRNRDELDSNSTPEELFANMFSQLLTIDNQLTDEQEFNNKNIRGKVQDRNVVVELQPDFVLTFYTSPTELAPSTYFMKEIDRINSSRALRFVLEISNTATNFDDESVFDRHLKSIEYFNSYLSTHAPRAIDYFGRAMDYFTLRNYESAVADFTRAIEASPDFALAYFMRAAANAKILKIGNDPDEDGSLALDRQRLLARSIIADYDEALKLSPNSPFPFFNKGNLYADLQDYTSAISAYSKAIELKPDFGEAYYNRGYVYFRLGNKEAGAADLSRAGQLGIVQAYNLLKRMDL